MGKCQVYLKLLQAVIAESHILLQLGVVLLQLGVVLLCLLVQISKAGHLHSSTRLPIEMENIIAVKAAEGAQIAVPCDCALQNSLHSCIIGLSDLAACCMLDTTSGQMTVHTCIHVGIDSFWART